MTTAKKKTTPARPRKETVAAPADKGGVPHVPPTPPTPPVPVVRAPMGTPVVNKPHADAPLALNENDKGFCDNHPDVPAVLVTNFPWAEQQRFCRACVPDQYRFLL